MLIWALKYWKYIAVAFAVLAIVGCVYGYGEAKEKRGYASCMVDVQAAKDAANERTIKKQKVIRKKLAEKTHEIKKQNDDRPVGALLERYFDSLRSANKS